MTRTERIARALCLAALEGFNSSIIASVYDRTEPKPKFSAKMKDRIVNRHYREYMDTAELLLKEEL